MANSPRKHGPAAKSAIAVARLLSTEGFTSYTAQQVKRYALKSIATPRMRARYKQSKRAFAESVASKLSAGDKAILGAWVAKLLRMSFDTGLRIGITSFLYGGRVTEEQVQDLGEFDGPEKSDGAGTRNRKSQGLVGDTATLPGAADAHGKRIIGGW